jgi:hypothetical protein
LLTGLRSGVIGRLSGVNSDTRIFRIDMKSVVIVAPRLGVLVERAG